MELTQDQLNQQIVTTAKSVLGSGELLDVIKAQIAESVAPYQKAQTDIIAQMFAAQRPAEKVEREKGLAFGRIVRAIAAGRGRDPEATLKAWGDADLAKAFAETQTKAMSAGQASAGGYIVPVEYSQDIIPLRRAMTVVRGSGPREIPMSTGTVKIPKVTAGSSGGYIGENSNAPVSQPTLGQITLTFKKLAILVPVSNDLIRYSSPSADALVRDDIVAGLAVTEDAVLLRSNGTNGEPMGLRYLAPVANILDAAAASLANASLDLGRLLLQLKNANVPLIRPVFLMSPRTEHYLLTIQNTSGFWAFRDEMVTRKTVYGVPDKTTTSIPNTVTVGANSDCSEIYLVDFDSMVLGDSQNLQIDASGEASYPSGSTLVSAYSLDQTVIRAIAEHDFNARDANAIAVLNGVRWGA